MKRRTLTAAQREADRAAKEAAQASGLSFYESPTPCPTCENNVFSTANQRTCRVCHNGAQPATAAELNAKVAARAADQAARATARASGLSFYESPTPCPTCENNIFYTASRWCRVCARSTTATAAELNAQAAARAADQAAQATARARGLSFYESPRPCPICENNVFYLKPRSRECKACMSARPSKQRAKTARTADRAAKAAAQANGEHIYESVKPCVKCGGTVFYLGGGNRKCKACDNAQPQRKPGTARPGTMPTAEEVRQFFKYDPKKEARKRKKYEQEEAECARVRASAPERYDLPMLIEAFGGKLK